MLFLAMCLLIVAGCVSDKSEDTADGTPLVVVPVDTGDGGDDDNTGGGTSPSEEGQDGGDNAGGTDTPGGSVATDDDDFQPSEQEPSHPLFSYAPGTMVSMSSYAGTVDPVGTTILNDFDGDGLTNETETTSNVWIADYPNIETSIATPVTMEIEILYSNDTDTKTISTNISASDMQSTLNKSSDKIHRNETNNRTVQYQDTESSSSASSWEQSSGESSSGEISVSGRGVKHGLKIRANADYAALGNDVEVEGTTRLGSSFSKSVEDSSGGSSSSSSESTVTKWKDQPFKNNVRAGGWSRKHDSSRSQSTQFRQEYRGIVDESKKIKPNSGYVRAALYITNNSVNMPVKISNILCSFMLEDNSGSLLPIQSFRLRNDDYSMFELSLYGQTTFGPYVIELTGLNSHEIKNAITRGYNPRIFLVDYEMSHVPDSNYRLALSSSFTGNNLKIIEENAKGRTAGVKFIYPGTREFFRVTAFDTDGTESRTGSSGATSFSPGVSLEKALTRISYSGYEIEYANVVFDTSGAGPEMDIPRFHVRVVKSINGVGMRLPSVFAESEPQTITGDMVDEDGNLIGGSSEAYVMKPIDEWTEEEKVNFRIWAVFANGRYYLHTKDVVSAGDIPAYFEYTHNEQTYRVPMVEGIESTVWPGDHYDVVCLDFGEQEEEESMFGYNPFETGEKIYFNTRWNLNTIGKYPFYPDDNSAYLGEASLGDTIEFTFELLQTRYLNPDFGTAETTGGKSIYKDFSYDLDRPVADQKFYLEEAVDFEVSFGLGGEYTDWFNLTDPVLRSPLSTYAPDTSDRNWNFLEQIFTLRMPIPTDLSGVGPDKMVKVFIRPSRNSAFRDSVWPLPYEEVKKFRGILADKVDTSSDQLIIADVVGTPDSGDTLVINDQTYTIDTASLENDTYVITLSSGTPILEEHASGEKVHIDLTTPLTEPIIQVEVDDGFEAAWNTANPLVNADHNTEDDVPLAVNDEDPDSPVNYLGYVHNQMETNWVGYQNFGNPYWNTWADSSRFKPLEEVFDPLLVTGSMDLSIEYVGNSSFAPEFLKQGAEISVSTSNTNDQTHPQIGIFGEKALVIWSSFDSSNDYDIKGQIVNLEHGNEGELIGSEFVVNDSTGDQKAPQFSILGEKALVVWKSNDNGSDYDIKGQVIDLSAGHEGGLIGSEISVSTINTNDQSSPILGMSGDKALIIWISYDDQTLEDIKAQVVDMEQGHEGELIGSEFLVGTNDDYEQKHPKLSIANGKAFIVWSTRSGSPTYEIAGQVINMVSGHEGEVITSEFRINTSTSRYQWHPSVVANGDKALVAWQSYQNGVFYLIKGQVINLADSNEGVKIGSELSISNNNISDQLAVGLGQFGDTTLAVWRSYDNGNDYDVAGQLINMSSGHEGELIGSKMLISSKNEADQYPSLISRVDDNRALVIWSSYDNGVDSDIRARLVNMATGHLGELVGDEISISSLNSGQQLYPQMISFNNKAMVVWQSQDNGSDYDIKSQIIGTEIKSLNYFKAPLIERDYKVKAQILDE